MGKSATSKPDVIVLEGIDGVGKTTVANMLKNLHNYAYVKPEYDFIDNAVDDYIISQQTHQKTFYNILKQLNSGNRVVVDRWYLSTYVYLYVKDNVEKIAEKLVNVFKHQVKMIRFIEEEKGKSVEFFIVVAKTSYIEKLYENVSKYDPVISKMNLSPFVYINDVYYSAAKQLKDEKINVNLVEVDERKPFITLSDVIKEKINPVELGI